MEYRNPSPLRRRTDTLSPRKRAIIVGARSSYEDRPLKLRNNPRRAEGFTQRRKVRKGRKEKIRLILCALVRQPTGTGEGLVEGGSEPGALLLPGGR
jgi:hypothetical protein